MNLGTRRASRGQTLALFAVLLPGLMAGMALGIDGANLWLSDRNAQQAADLAALAGARLLPLTPTAADRAAATAAARAVADANGCHPTAGCPAGWSVTATTPYVDGAGVSHQDYVEVKIASTVRNYFLPVLGVSSFPLNSRAVALSLWTPTTGGLLPAIFAGCDSSGGTSCPDSAKAIEWSGSRGRVEGGTVSNCGILASGQDGNFNGGTEYRTDCSITRGSNTYNPEPTSQPREPWPLNIGYNDFLPCDFTETDGELLLKDYYMTGTTILRDGVYCAPGSSAKMILADSNVTGRVTLVSGGTVEVSGQFYNLTAYHSSKVVIWAGGCSSPTIKLAGSDGIFTGIVYSRCGQVEVSGEGVSTTGGGSILADRVKIAGDDFFIDSNGLSGLGAPVLDKLQLVE